LLPGDRAANTARCDLLSLNLGVSKLSSEHSGVLLRRRVFMRLHFCSAVSDLLIMNKPTSWAKICRLPVSVGSSPAKISPMGCDTLQKDRSNTEVSDTH
jgi:hypothetical protein